MCCIRRSVKNVSAFHNKPIHASGCEVVLLPINTALATCRASLSVASASGAHVHREDQLARPQKWELDLHFSCSLISSSSYSEIHSWSSDRTLNTDMCCWAVLR